MWVENDDLIEMREALEKLNTLFGDDDEETIEDIIKKYVIADNARMYADAMKRFKKELFILAGENGSVNVGENHLCYDIDYASYADEESFTDEFKEMIKERIREREAYNKRIQETIEKKKVEK